LPALVVEGEKGLATTVESARVLAESLPNASLVLIAEAGHYPQAEQPDRFFPVVARFLDGSRRTNGR
jgi:pimeloyl-ACP methyl ester carboxylesterase